MLHELKWLIIHFHDHLFSWSIMYIFIYMLQRTSFNSLAPGRFKFYFRKVIFKLTLLNGDWGISFEIALRWIPNAVPGHLQAQCWLKSRTSSYASFVAIQWLCDIFTRSVASRLAVEFQANLKALCLFMLNTCHWIQFPDNVAKACDLLTPDVSVMPNGIRNFVHHWFR